MDNGRVLLLDSRIGSRDLQGGLERQGVPCDLTCLEFGDAAFVGRGINDEPITIGIELKRIKTSDGTRADLISSLRTGRLAGHQLGGLQAFDRAWLITEGLWRANEAGELEVYEGGRWQPVRQGKSTLMMRDIESQLLTITTRGGASYWHCPTVRDTVRFIATLFRWWTDKALDEHRSHQAIYLPPPDRAIFIEPSPFLKMVSCLPGIGYDKALAIEAHFGSFDRLFAASEKDLCGVAGIGTTLAKRIVNTLHSSAASSSTPSQKSVAS